MQSSVQRLDDVMVWYDLTIKLVFIVLGEIVVWWLVIYVSYFYLFIVNIGLLD
jgi:hypothetical protein